MNASADEKKKKKKGFNLEHKYKLYLEQDYLCHYGNTTEEATVKNCM